MKLILLLLSPLVFGLGFFAPLIAQCMTQFGLSIGNIDNLIVGLVIGGLWGVMAQYRGSWVWVNR